MSCEHYWREGILLVERGEPDPHRDVCLECRRAHEARDHLVGALPAVARTRSGDPSWQTRVWGRIARDEASRARRSYWIAGGLVAAAAIALICVRFVPFGAGGGDHRVADRPRFDIVSGPLAMRSTSARVGDRVRISVGRGQEARVYRADHLVLRCPARSTAPGCMPDDQGMVAEALLATAGEYQLVMILSATADPVGTLDRDLAAVVSAGGEYKVTELSVR
jgi:hypothetical protein